MIFSLYFLSFSGIFKFQSHYITLFCKNQHILEIFVIYLKQLPCSHIPDRNNKILITFFMFFTELNLLSRYTLYTFE
ncbi:hypothetical protein DEH83_02955 [Streptococcus constellatus]|nr:hypothetical protein DEH83_02955 [Streptococcus constellatus]